jgi:hypothetical protein
VSEFFVVEVREVEKGRLAPAPAHINQRLGKACDNPVIQLLENEADLRAPPQFEVRQACFSGLDRIKSDESVTGGKERFRRLICQFLI